MGCLPDVEESYAGELLRKGIHLCSISIPIAYYHLGKSTTLSILVPLTALFFLSDAARLIFPRFREFYEKVFGGLLRSHERNYSSRSFNGATYVLVSACLCVLIFPMVIAIMAFSILIISDTSAALVGRRYGDRPFLKKSLAGSLAFLVTALMVVLLTPKIAYVWSEFLIGILASVVGTIVEALALRVDDNLLIPLTIGGVAWMLYGLMIPQLNPFALDF